MSDVYISGMEMPKEGFVEIIIRDDGTVQQTGQSYRVDGTDYYTPYVGEMPVTYKAISVSDHGRLINIDSKTFPTPHRNPSNDYMRGWNACLRSVQQQPTIIPADLPVMYYPQVPGITPTVISDTEEDR